MDAQEYDELVVPIRQRMVNAIWRITRDAHATDDVLQDVLVRMLRRFGRIRRHPNPTALVLRMCVNEAIDHVRRRRRHAVALEAVRVAEAQRGGLTGQAEHAEAREAVLQALGMLPKREAEAMVLLAVEELSSRDIAEAMGCRESTVRVLISKARKRLRAALKRGDIALDVEVSES
ncbi:MAG: RNA polymerase sigma factor [Candidatus Hydrogenedentes bacterium]|nr:RNA polymerase sigma factor [Candidatus Hydrogenedentota bacterium]